jgi:hypothetical protein
MSPPIPCKRRWKVMREIIEHVKVVTSNGENINFQDVLQAGF